MSAERALEFDLSALREPVPDAEAKAEGVQRLRDEVGERAGTAVKVSAVVRPVILVLGAAALAALLVSVVQQMSGAPGFTVWAAVIGALMVLPLAIAQVRGISSGLRDMPRVWYALRRFAAANRLTHVLREVDPERPAALFRIGGDRVSTDIVTGATPRAFEAANYRFETWAARTRMPHQAAYVSFVTRVPLPAATLVSRARLPSPSWKPAQGQRRIEIGGGVDELFQVHCAPADDDAVRGMLTPAAQAALSEVASHVDVEIVAGRVFFLVRQSLPIQSPAFWEWTEDLSGLLDTTIDPRAAAVRGGGQDPHERARRRAELFRVPAGGRPFVIGCLLPLVAGIALGVVTAMWP